jgi:hypothetical protein
MFVIGLIVDTPIIPTLEPLQSYKKKVSFDPFYSLHVKRSKNQIKNNFHIKKCQSNKQEYSTKLKNQVCQIIA